MEIERELCRFKACQIGGPRFVVAALSHPVTPMPIRSVPLEKATHQESGKDGRELDCAARNPIYRSIARQFAVAYPNRTSARQAVPRFGAIAGMRRISRAVPIGSETSSPDCRGNRKGGCDPA